MSIETLRAFAPEMYNYWLGVVRGLNAETLDAYCLGAAGLPDYVADLATKERWRRRG